MILFQQVEELKEKLRQNSQLNIRLTNELDEVNSVNMQTLNDKDIIITDLRKQLESLQAKLDNTTQTFGELEKRLKEANIKLEFYASSLNGNHDGTLLEREQELEQLKQEMDELRRRVGDGRISSDTGAQTSPLKEWAQVSSDKFRELERKYEESHQMNQQYNKILREKEMALQEMKQQVRLQFIYVQVVLNFFGFLSSKQGFHFWPSENLLVVRDEVRCQLGHDLRNTKTRQGEKLAGKTSV